MERAKDREVHWKEMKEVRATTLQVAEAHKKIANEPKSLKETALEVTDEWKCMTEASCGKAGKKINNLRTALK